MWGTDKRERQILSLVIGFVVAIYESKGGFTAEMVVGVPMV